MSQVKGHREVLQDEIEGHGNGRRTPGGYDRRPPQAGASWGGGDSPRGNAARGGMFRAGRVEGVARGLGFSEKINWRAWMRYRGQRRASV
jgi:hypothetical protein